MSNAFSHQPYTITMPFEKSGNYGRDLQRTVSQALPIFQEKGLDERLRGKSLSAGLYYFFVPPSQGRSKSGDFEFHEKIAFFSWKTMLRDSKG